MGPVAVGMLGDGVVTVLFGDRNTGPVAVGVLEDGIVTVLFGNAGTGPVAHSGTSLGLRH